jgi:hypothetical protein
MKGADYALFQIYLQGVDVKKNYVKERAHKKRSFNVL